MAPTAHMGTGERKERSQKAFLSCLPLAHLEYYTVCEFLWNMDVKPEMIYVTLKKRLEANPGPILSVADRKNSKYFYYFWRFLP